MLDDHLQKLNALVDPDHVSRARERMLASVSFEPVDRLPVCVNCPVPGWPRCSYREGFEDMEKMLINELEQVWVGAHVRDDRMYTIRANYGVGGLASLFGCGTRLTDDNTMPWTFPLGDRELDKVLESGEVDIEAGLGSRVFETERYYLKMLSRYENLAQCVHIFVSDTQGPFDNAHLVMGHKIYTEVYDNPERVHRLLEIATDTYIRFTRAQKELIGESGPTHYHGQSIVRGTTRMCEDSSINLSADFYREFCKPYNERAFAELGGGWIHYCGNGRQILPDVMSTEGVTGVNFGNPEMQDIGSIYEQAAPRRIAVLTWPGRSSLPDTIATGVTTAESAPDLESARRVVEV